MKVVRSMKNCCIEVLMSDLRDGPWSVIDTFDSMDDKWGCWKSLLLSVLDRHAPLRKIRVRRSSLPWITAEVLKINRARNYFRIKKALKDWISE